jgi:hypothetical protein
MENQKSENIFERRFVLWMSSNLSLCFLLFSNIVTIFFAITENWDLSTIMLVYWFQSIIIGFFNFIRILQLEEFSTKGLNINGRPAQPTQGTKNYIAFFFLAHYGIFHFGYLNFILTGAFDINENIMTFIELKFVLLTALIFL